MRTVLDMKPLALQYWNAFAVVRNGDCCRTEIDMENCLQLLGWRCPLVFWMCGWDAREVRQYHNLHHTANSVYVCVPFSIQYTIYLLIYHLHTTLHGHTCYYNSPARMRRWRETPENYLPTLARWSLALCDNSPPLAQLLLLDVTVVNTTAESYVAAAARRRLSHPKPRASLNAMGSESFCPFVCRLCV